MPNKLEEARKIIDDVDVQMAELFVKRMRAAEMVCEHKMALGLPILDRKREDEVIERNSALIGGEVLKGYYIDYLKHLMSVSRAYQYRMQSGLKVAYSGVEGAFAHIAAGKIFPEGNRISYSDFKAAYDSVVRGESDVAVLPIENSYAGEVGQTIDLIFSGSLFINGIYELEIHQNLLGVPGATLEDVKKVTSHPQALSQCHDYIKMRGLETEEANNTALAAKTVAEANNKSLGAIASVETAEIYGLKVIEVNINKSGENTTRFAVLSKVKATSPSLTSTVLMFTVKHEAGSLANAIGIIGKYGYNMTALRSRPMKKHSWQYYFYVEI
ncbi:MAG: bifunctional chorismate mutase/prephenate dehydratase, partial [Ruminococcaceae bacterium]|nr:bifunctional chorismate mutase/prephenate dehydratase [Oscillospiraceae bacterium]